METDIRPLIYEWRLEEETLFLCLAAGSAANVKPDTVMEAFDAFRGKESEPFAYHFHRLEMYAEADGELVPLYALGENIAAPVPGI